MTSWLKSSTYWLAASVVRLKPCYRALLCFVLVRVQAMGQKPQIQERIRIPEGQLESTVLLCFVLLRVQVMGQKPHIQEKNQDSWDLRESTVLQNNSATLQGLWAIRSGMIALAGLCSFPQLLCRLQRSFRGIADMDLPQFVVLQPSADVLIDVNAR